MKQFVYNLCNPVVGAVPGHLTGYVVAFKDVESSDQGNTYMWGWGHHHVVSYRNTNKSYEIFRISIVKLNNFSGKVKYDNTNQ